MNRRNAIMGILCAPLAYLFGGRAKAEPVTIEFVADTSKFREDVRKALEEIPPVPQGVEGVTYFKASFRRPRFPVGKRLYLDGVDVTNRSNECDLVGGWVVMYDVNAAGKKLVKRGTRVHYGRVEIRQSGQVWTRDDVERMRQSLTDIKNRGDLGQILG